jgi:hypothetical protein
MTALVEAGVLHFAREGTRIDEILAEARLIDLARRKRRG